MAILNYRDHDWIPVVHFGFWDDTIAKWRGEGHFTQDEFKDGSYTTKMGFDYDWHTVVGGNPGLLPGFESRVLEELPGGLRKVVDAVGLVQLVREGVHCIPATVDYLLKGRKEWEELYLPKLQYSPERVDIGYFQALARAGEREYPLGLHCGSLYGSIRNMLGIEGSAYLYADDEDLFTEFIDRIGELSYQVVAEILATGATFDFAHFWEDICFKNGPLIAPKVFNAKVGPHYKRITDLVGRHGISIVSLDCDGCIDALIPTWLDNGVNTMFPIEVGTWNASIKPWREKYGKELRGVGGMNKLVLAQDHAAVDAEIERLRPLVDLGGFIPCPDHRIPPDAEFANVQYYCERMHEVFGSPGPSPRA